ncbi:hypothetical protein DXH95_03165 [Sphingorhabdus pulchriflava]|uniref:Uncharacterized protein n=1 Tax=Sphingorhabdus pulchriflava TaxID=2292257 RepID=A0A371BGF5_9SPHN|nr:hypothetical protein [Sphingorhabdus pulchriflava]RDV06441.1 hypothetical protein DXH95_03165 [Sphingorhabdus pulchriflava]
MFEGWPISFMGTEFTPGGGGAQPGYFSASGSSTGGAPSPAWSDAVTLSIVAADLKPSTEYVGFWSVDETRSSATTAQARLMVDGAQSDLQRVDLKESSPFDKNNMGGFFLYTTGASPTDAEFIIQVQGSSATFTNPRLTLLEIGVGDETAQDLTGVSTTSTSLVDALTCAFTPPSSGDYLVLACGNFTAATTGMAYVQLTDGTTSTPEIRIGSHPNNTAGFPVVLALGLSGVSGAKTISFKYRTGSGSFSVTADNIRIIVLRLDRFNSSNISVLGSDNGGTNATYTVAHSQTFTPAVADYLTIAAGWILSSSASVSSQGRIVDDGTVIAETIRETALSSTHFPIFTHRLTSFAASSRTQSIDRLAEGGGVTTTLRQSALIASIELTGL